MRKYQFLSMIALALTVALSVAACGMGNNQNGVNSDDIDNRFNRTSRLEEANQNLIESVREAATAIHDGLMELSTMRR